MNILAIETSCDETSAAVVRDGREVLSNIIASQAQLHAQYGGVIPEVAARKHIQTVIPVIHQALQGAEMTSKDIDAIGVTVGPGLIGALLIGVDVARGMSYAWGKKIIPVHHIKGHVYANQIQILRQKKIVGAKDFDFPSLCLTVSGGHTEILLIKSHQEIEKIGSTLDDAAGEAFDKVAALLGLGYPGGPIVSEYAEQGNPAVYKFPLPMIHQDNFNFSFSGLKTAVRYAVVDEKKKSPELGNKTVQDICASFQYAAIEVLIAKTFQAVDKFGVTRVMLSGGVAANALLRKRFQEEALKRKIDFSYPPIELCTDNAAMIGAAAFFDKEKATSATNVNVDLQPVL